MRNKFLSEAPHSEKEGKQRLLLGQPPRKWLAAPMELTLANCYEHLKTTRSIECALAEVVGTRFGSAKKEHSQAERPPAQRCCQTVGYCQQPTNKTD